MSVRLKGLNGTPDIYADNEDIPALVDSGKYAPPETIRWRGVGGLETETDYDRFLTERKAKTVSTLPTQSDIDERGNQNIIEERNHGIVPTVKGALGGVVSGLTAGGVKPWEEAQRYHPYAAFGGQLVGALAPAFVGDEAGLAAIPEDVLNLARVGEGVEEAATAGKAALGFTPAGMIARVGRSAEALLPETIAGSKAAANVAKSAVGGAAYGGADYLAHAALDDDVHFSGEGFAHSIILGGALGGGLGGASEALGAAGSKLSQITGRASKGLIDGEEEAALKGYRAYGSADHPPGTRWTDSVDLGKSPNGLTAADAIATAQRDFHALADAAEELAEKKALVSVEDVGRIKALAPDVRYVGQKLELAGTNPTQYLGKVASRIDDAQELASIVRRYSPESVPGRWSDVDQLTQRVRGRQAVEAEIAKRGLPEGPAADGLRIANELGVGKVPTEATSAGGGMLAQIGRSVLKKIPGGRYILGGLSLGGGMELADLVAGGAHHIVGGVAHLALPVAAAALGAKALRMAFKDPGLGGMLTASTVNVLSRVHLFPGDNGQEHKDARVALRDLADRARRTPATSVATATVQSHQGVAGMSPASVMEAGNVAARRHSLLVQALDQADPPPSASQQLMGRPLPTQASATRAADAIRVLSSPGAVVTMAAANRLSPQALRLAEQAYPRTVAKLRGTITSLLSSVDARSLPLASRRTIETILGTAVLGPRTSSGNYLSVMQASVERTRASMRQQPKTPPAPAGPTQSSVMSPAQRAAHPGQGRG